MSDPPTTCPHCDTALPNDSPQTLCPSCLLKQAFFTQAPSSGDRGQIDPPPSPEAIADKFPQFEITECLGRGGMGVVYKARQKSLDRWVAIKILAPEKVSNPRFSERFTVEAQTLGMLNHNNIVTVFDYGETGGLYYIVMEYIDGISLRDFLNDGQVKADQALKIVTPICEALQYAHDKRIVHRDIKPENILIDNENRIKVADFGIASLIGSIGEAAGTPPYMAPEQDALTGVDHRADIYALGAVLYEMLTGERPESPLDIPSQKVELDIRIDDIVLRALSKEPERRYRTAYDFKTVVQTVVASQGTTTPTLSESASKQAKTSTSGKELDARSTKTSGAVPLVIRARMAILTICSIMLLMVGLAIFIYVDRLDMMREGTTVTSSDPSSIASAPILEANNELKVKNDIADTMSAKYLEASSMRTTASTFADLVELDAGSQAAQERQRRATETLPLEIELKQLGIVFRLIPPGEFIAGSPQNEAGRRKNETQKKVQFTRPFYMAKFEITQEQWEQVIGENPSHFQKAGGDAPVEGVGWNGIEVFIEKLSAMEELTMGQLRIATESEWEYACRAGTKGPFYIAGNIDAGGWYASNSDATTHPAGLKLPNAFGLYDMQGNVWELCYLDDFSSRVFRGGCWRDTRAYNRVAHRWEPTDDNQPQYHRGFRLMIDLAEETRAHRD